MKYRLIKIAAILAVLIHLSSCVVRHHTDNRSPGHARYRSAGRFW
jgi:hypothetical protein